jgi:inactivated superfamily I helicase
MLKSEYASQLTKAESRVVEIAAARDEASATADALRQQLEETKSVAAKVGVL